MRRNGGRGGGGGERESSRGKDVDIYKILGNFL